MAVTTYNTLVPALRFREFTDDWSVKYLSEFMAFRNGINADKQQYGQGYKFINVLDIIADKPITHDKIIGSVDISAAVFDKSTVSFGDILFQRSSETREEAGQANVYLDKDKPATFGGFVIRGKSKGNYQPVFMNFLLKTSLVRKEITARSGGSTRYNVGQATLENIPIVITKTDEEQQKIANFLTSVDTKIQQLKRKHTLMQQYKKGVIQQLFSQQVRFKDDDGRDYPDWKEIRLGEVCSTFKSGMGITSGMISDEGPFPVYGGNGLRGYTDTYTHEGAYLLIGRQGALCGNINRVDGKAYISEHAIAVQGNSLADTEWLAQRLSFYNLNRLSESSAQPGLSVNKLVRYKLSFPSLSEQKKIANFLLKLDTKINEIAKQINQAETFKKGLLQQMFV